MADKNNSRKLRTSWLHDNDKLQLKNVKIITYNIFYSELWRFAITNAIYLPTARRTTMLCNKSTGPEWSTTKQFSPEHKILVVMGAIETDVKMTH